MPSDKTRWYNTALQIVEQVPLAKPVAGRKTTAPTIRHARKFRFMPSITSVCDLLGSYQLEQYKQGRIIEACAACKFEYDIADLDPDDLETEPIASALSSYKDHVKKIAAERDMLLAQRGTELHGDVAKFFEGKGTPQDPVAGSICRNIAQYLGSEVKVTCELTVGSLEHGFAGTPDLFAEMGDGRTILIDLKTTSLKSFRTPYDKWLLQLGGYRRLTRGVGTTLVQAVADRETGETRFIEHENPEAWENAFCNLFEVWVVMNGYDPRTGKELGA